MDRLNGRESSCHHKASQNTGVSIDTMLIYTYRKFCLQPTAIYNLNAGLKYTVLKESRSPFRGAFSLWCPPIALSRVYSCNADTSKLTCRNPEPKQIHQKTFINQA